MPLWEALTGTAEPELAWRPNGRGPSPAIQGRDSADTVLHVPGEKDPGLHLRAQQRFVDEHGGVDGVRLGRESTMWTGSREQRLPLAHVLSLGPAAAPGYRAARGSSWLPGGCVDASAVPLSAKARALRPRHLHARRLVGASPRPPMPSPRLRTDWLVFFLSNEFRSCPTAQGSCTLVIKRISLNSERSGGARRYPRVSEAGAGLPRPRTTGTPQAESPSLCQGRKPNPPNPSRKLVFVGRIVSPANSHVKP